MGVIEEDEQSLNILINEHRKYLDMPQYAHLGFDRDLILLVIGDDPKEEKKPILAVKGGKEGFVMKVRTGTTEAAAAD